MKGRIEAAIDVSRMLRVRDAGISIAVGFDSEPSCGGAENYLFFEVV